MNAVMLANAQMEATDKNKWGMVRNQKPLAKKSSKLLKIRRIKFRIKDFFRDPFFCDHVMFSKGSDRFTKLVG